LPFLNVLDRVNHDEVVQFVIKFINFDVVFICVPGAQPHSKSYVNKSKVEI
jgi:hypothetical protein